MYLDEIVAAQKRGDVKGIASICSAHPWVMKAAMQQKSGSLLIEATCNQVNQFGGYTRMTPIDFVRYVHGIANENKFSTENLILGGDHLGPNVWQNEPADSAMRKSTVMIRDYLQAGFVKIHLDCSMKLGDDLESTLDPEISAQRAAQLAKVAEASRLEGFPLPRYVLGTEVPIPGGAVAYEEAVGVTKVKDVQQTIDVMRQAFSREGLESAWERVVALVVQPGVEFGDDFVLEYQPEKAQALSRFIESQPMIYEAHSTDYQPPKVLENLVRDHFAVLKVGPALTFAFREAVFALVLIENELFSKDTRSNLMEILDGVMIQQPEYWKKYYHGDEAEQALKRRYSLSDRVRYYWSNPQIQSAFENLLSNLKQKPIPFSLLSQFAPNQYKRIRRSEIENTPESILLDHVYAVLSEYQAAQH
jgi:D-tagatose-1,6-bisphosphate aldolase subunit GatZ/KbaZ